MRGDVGTAVRDLYAIRGWLLVVAILLVPHIVLTTAILVRSWPLLAAAAPLSGIERLRVVTEAVLLAGNATGLVLILRRSRYAPAFFTLYVPVTILLALVDPNLTATQQAYAHRLGLHTGPAGAAPGPPPLVGQAVSFVASGAILGYWLVSKRVQAVFGSRGLEVFHRR